MIAMNKILVSEFVRRDDLTWLKVRKWSGALDGKKTKKVMW